MILVTVLYPWDEVYQYDMGIETVCYVFWIHILIMYCHHVDYDTVIVCDCAMTCG
jgi:hypothetical protein